MTKGKGAASNLSIKLHRIKDTRRRGGAHMGFSERIDTILKETELIKTDGGETGLF